MRMTEFYHDSMLMSWRRSMKILILPACPPVQRLLGEAGLGRGTTTVLSDLFTFLVIYHYFKLDGIRGNPSSHGMVEGGIFPRNGFYSTHELYPLGGTPTLTETHILS